MTNNDLPPIPDNLQRVQARINAAAQSSGRDPQDITLVAVTKTHPVPYIQTALEADQYDFGENRVEEAFSKFIDQAEDFVRRPRLHLIGPIQSRKAKIAVGCQPVLIHSVDRLKIAKKLNDHAVAAATRLQILLQVNISGELSKHGFSARELRAEIPAILSLPGLAVNGLMTIPPYDPNPEAARPHYAALRRLRDDLLLTYPDCDLPALSMGMSHDFEVAISEGATLVRVGSAIFGARN